MEISVVARQASAAGSELLMIPAGSRLQVAAKQRRKIELPVASVPPAMAALRCRRRIPGVRCAAVARAEEVAARKVSSRRSGADNSPQLFVGLPVDAVSDCNTLNHAKAIAAGLKAIKLLGVDGVELPVWWGVAEKEAMGEYNWSGYLALLQMIRAAGLKVRISLYFHASAEPVIPLPQWVSAAGDADPDIFFTDKSGKRRRECLSLAVDDLPVLQGKTPLQVYGDFLQSFRGAFSEFLGSTITDVLVGLGPDGELKYSSSPPSIGGRQRNAGAGEFQCYDRNMLNQLRQHADASGNHYWGLSGPHDAPRYNQSPDSGNFFRDGGSWETPYGDFFLSWYSGRLLSHADRRLSAASAALGDLPVAVYGKVPVVHAWYKSRSHPAELTAGFYNTAERDGYEPLAEVFARHSCGMLLPSMDLADERQPAGTRSSPESLLAQIMRACKRHGVRVAGENNSSIRGTPNFSKIKQTLSWGTPSTAAAAAVDKFTYQRMGAYFFSPEHFPLFTQFVRNLDWSDLHPDDLPAEDGEAVPLTSSSTATVGSLEMQAAA